jgi:hypothetical protein
MVGGLHLVSLFVGALNRAEFTFSEVLVPWIVIVGALGGNCRRQLPTVRGALSEMDHAVQQLRERNLLTDLTLDAPFASARFS